MVSFLKQQLYDVVPEVSTLKPLLFLTYINDLKNALGKCIVHHFTDDFSLFGNRSPEISWCHE